MSLVTICLICPIHIALGQEDPSYSSPDGTWHIEESDNAIWVVSTNDTTQRAKLVESKATTPDESPALPDEFHGSSNNSWIFTLRHVGSCLRAGDLYHRISSSRIEALESFDELAWDEGTKLHALGHNFSAEGSCAMALFCCWSIDSGRLLLQLRGGEKDKMQTGYLYFNTHTQKFELTDYLRKLNRTKPEILACAEPLDPLPVAAELKKRLDDLDRRLNKQYARVLAQTQPDQVPNVREAQRTWMRHRDEGVKLYLSRFPAAEKEKRRLQFMGDVTAARIEVPAGQWEL